MIKKLYIRNFAIVDELEIKFNAGFQVLTGETGAGKSIIAGAISLLCGERGQSDLVKNGAKKAILEAEIQIRKKSFLQKLLSKYGIDDFEDMILIRREINSSGISRAFINDSPVSISDLSQFTEKLIDLHGQHQHQRLINTASHREYLDAFGQYRDLLEKYQISYKHYFKKREELQELQKKNKENAEKKELLLFQFNELNKSQLSPGEYEQLDKESKILENSEKIYAIAQETSDYLTVGDYAILHNLSDVIKKLNQIAAYDQNIEELVNNLETARVSVEETGQYTEKLINDMDFNPERLDEIRTRLAELDWLIKKYNVASYQDLISLKTDLEHDLHKIENFDHLQENLKKELIMIRDELKQDALNLSDVRKKTAEEFSQMVLQLLKSLGMQNPLFITQIDYVSSEKGEIEINQKNIHVYKSGIDNIQFLISLNPGQPPRPLQKIASGGEISRIVIAIKSLIAESDDTPILIFDEIDTGISGKVAQIVGKKMELISENRQLIAITHLPQIAAQADNHYLVSKSNEQEKVNVMVEELDAKNRIEELAKLLGGEKITPEAIANAQSLLNESVYAR